MTPNNVIASPQVGDIERWGSRVLWAGLLGGLAGALALAWIAPAFVPFVPLGVVGMVGFVVLFRHPFANLGVLLAGIVITLDNTPGLQAGEIAYGLYYYTFLLYWYGTALLRGDRFVRTAVDRAVVLLIVFGTLGGVVLGGVFGAEFGDIRGEATAWLMLGLYFPVKELCRTHERGAELVLVAFLIVGAFIAVRHFVNFRSIILAATAQWQVADARPGFNEMQLLIPALGSLVGLVVARSYWQRALLLLAFMLITGALILTKSRGYWIDFAFGVVLLVVLLRGRHQWRLIVLLLGGSAAVIALTLIFFGPIADLIFSGTANRFTTLGTAFTEDRSLVNRFIETRTVMEGIMRNPVLGYGFGTQFSYFDINFLATSTTSFIHNGYIALWFKLGLWGMVLMLFSWGVTAWRGLQVYRNYRVPRRHRAAALIASVTLIAILPSAGTSNPFIIMDQVYTFTLQLALAGGLYQRYLAKDVRHALGQ